MIKEASHTEIQAYIEYMYRSRYTNTNELEVTFPQNNFLLAKLSVHSHSQIPIVVEHILLRGICVLEIPYQRSEEMKAIVKQTLKEVQ